jgi:hypothetical protein
MLEYQGGDVKGKRSKRKGNGPGGRREGSGRPTYFRGKSASSDDPMYRDVPAALCINMTRKGRTIVERQSEAIGVSMNVLMEALVWLYGRRVTKADVERADRMATHAT